MSNQFDKATVLPSFDFDIFPSNFIFFNWNHSKFRNSIVANFVGLFGINAIDVNSGFIYI